LHKYPIEKFVCKKKESIYPSEGTMKIDTGNSDTVRLAIAERLSM
jgi:hypothetical protein